MDYPNLLLAIRSSGRCQYEIARLAGLREGRLSEIVRRGAAKPSERKALSRVLRATEAHLFDIGASPARHSAKRNGRRLAREHQTTDAQ
jgi:hypothetical protein